MVDKQTDMMPSPSPQVLFGRIEEDQVVLSVVLVLPSFS